MNVIFIRPNQSINQSINALASTECGDLLPFSGASSIPACRTFFPATLLRRPFFHPSSLHPVIYFLVYLLVLLFPDSYTILFWESYFLPFSVHVQTNVIYAALLSLLNVHASNLFFLIQNFVKLRAFKCYVNYKALF